MVPYVLLYDIAMDTSLLGSQAILSEPVIRTAVDAALNVKNKLCLFSYSCDPRDPMEPP